jgi:hypothetical protein
MIREFIRPLSESERMALQRTANMSEASRKIPIREFLPPYPALWPILLVLSVTGFLSMFALIKESQIVFIVIISLITIIVGMVSFFFTITLVNRWYYVRFELKREQSKGILAAQDALARNQVRVLHVEATAVVQIEEFEDEGTSYLFQVESHKVLFLQGQYFNEVQDDPNWPNEVFEISEHYWPKIICLGKRLEPLRVIQPTEIKLQTEWPQDGEQLDGDLQAVVLKYLSVTLQ